TSVFSSAERPRRSLYTSVVAPCASSSRANFKRSSPGGGAVIAALISASALSKSGVNLAPSIHLASVGKKRREATSSGSIAPSPFLSADQYAGMFSRNATSLNAARSIAYGRGSLEVGVAGRLFADVFVVDGVDAEGGGALPQAENRAMRPMGRDDFG